MSDAARVQLVGLLNYSTAQYRMPAVADCSNQFGERREGQRKRKKGKRKAERGEEKEKEAIAILLACER